MVESTVNTPFLLLLKLKLKKAALLLVIGTITSKGGLEVTRDEGVHSS